MVVFSGKVQKVWIQGYMFFLHTQTHKSHSARNYRACCKLFFLARYYTKFFRIDVCILILASSTVVLSVQSVKSKIVVFFFFLQFYAEISNHSQYKSMEFEKQRNLSVLLKLSWICLQYSSYSCALTNQFRALSFS